MRRVRFVRRTRSGRYELRYYDRDGERRSGGSGFTSRSAAFAHFRDVIEPQLRGELPPSPDLTLADLVEVYLDRHGAIRRGRTIETLRERLRLATAVFGDTPLRDLERMSAEIADWQVSLPERSRYGIVQALRQTLNAAVRWDYMGRNRPRSRARTRNRRRAPSAPTRSPRWTRSPRSYRPAISRSRRSQRRQASGRRSGPLPSAAT
jgi:hypothetical protein